jgi:hypothetical protein
MGQIENEPGHSWLVRYSKDDLPGNVPAKRFDFAIRVQVIKNAATDPEPYTIKLRRYNDITNAGEYVPRPLGGDLEFRIDGELEGGGSPRKRLRLKTLPETYKKGGKDREVILIMIWHPGQNPDPAVRTDDRLQVRLIDRLASSAFAAAAPAPQSKNAAVLAPVRHDCPEEPDTDVLEETDEDIEDPPADEEEEEQP